MGKEGGGKEEEGATDVYSEDKGKEKKKRAPKPSLSRFRSEKDASLLFFFSEHK